MFRLINLIPFFNTPDDAGSGGSGTEPLSENDILKMLDDEGEDEDVEDGEVIDLNDKAPKKDTSKKADKEDTSEEADDNGDGEDSDETEETDDDPLKEIEEELAEPDEEKLQLMAPAKRRDILAKYPNLFKDFPYLQAAYYREQQFTERFATVDEADAALEAVQVLNKFEADLAQGNLDEVFGSIHKSDANSFYKIVDNFLPTLAKLDEKAYHHVLSGVLKQTISSMIQDSRNSDNEEDGQILANVATILHKYVFGGNKFEPHKPLAKEEQKSEKESELEKKQKDFARQQFETASSNLATKLDNILRASIDANIDPKGQMSDYVKRNAIKDAQSKIEELLGKDTRFRQLIAKQWRVAVQSGYKPETLAEIRRTYLTRAKSLMLPVLTATRKEALKGNRPSIRKEELEDKPTRKGPLSSGKSTTSVSSGNSTGKKSNGIPKGMSATEYIMSDEP